jgi:hypothetical protein
MVRRVASAEANKSGTRAVARGKHGSRAARPHHAPTPAALRMPAQYSTRDVELLLDALWGMFTQSQARQLEVQVPWDEGEGEEEPQRIRLADLAAQMESWLA